MRSVKILAAALAFAAVAAPFERSFAMDESQGPRVLVRTMDNGLTVVIRENRTAPVVALRAYVKKTGRIYEAPYIGCGIAHNLEHLVAGGTTSSRTEEENKAILREIGGNSNAYTHMDHTCYFINTAASSMDKALGLLSDWLMNCALKQEEVDRERETITEEISRGDDDWTRAAHEEFYKALFPGHPVSIPTIGFVDTFRSVTRDDLLAYYNERYIPQNTIFVVVGDVDAEAAFSKVEAAFKPWPRGRERDIPVPEVRRIPGMKWVETSHPAARTCLVYMGFHSTDLAHPDMYAMDVLALVLSRGRAARLPERIVDRERLAAQAGAYNMTPSYGCGVFTAYALGLPYPAVRKTVDTVLEELERCAKELVVDEELERAKTQTIAAHVFHRQKTEEQAEDLGYNLMGMNDPHFSEKYIARIKQVTADEVRAAAAKYLNRDNLTVCVMHPPGAEKTAAAPGGVSTAPEPEGEVIKMTLKNGLRVLIQRNTNAPMATLQAWCRAGLGAEPPGKNGINNLTASLLASGTRSRAKLQFSRELEAAGGQVECSGGNNTLGVKMDVIEQGLDKAFELFADMLLEPSFPADEVEKAKTLAIRGIERKLGDADEQAVWRYRARFFGTHPYSKVEDGSPDEIAGITRDDVQAYYDRWFAPQNVVLSIFGDFKVARVKEMVESRFNAMESPGSFEPVPVPAVPGGNSGSVDEESPFGNVHLVVGFQGPTMTDDDRWAMSIMNLIVSAGSGNRIHDVLRGKEEGLVYSVYGSCWPGIGTGTYYVAAQTAPEKAERVLSLIMEELRKVAADGVTDKELEDAKRDCVVGEMFYKQTLSGQAQWTALCELYGQGFDFPKRYLPLIEKVSAADVKAAAQKYLKDPLIFRMVPKKK